MSPTRTAAANLQAVESFKALFETAPDGMLVVDASGRIVLCNPQVERLFGYTQAELAGQPVETLIPATHRISHERLRRGFQDNARTRPMGSGMDLHALHRSGHEFPVEIALSPMQLDAGLFVVASIRDITETRRAQEAMRRAHYSEQLARLGELALASRDLDELLAAIPSVVGETVQADIVIVYLLNSSHTEFLCKGAHGLTESERLGLNEPNTRRSQPGFVVATGEPLVVEDYENESRFDINPAMQRRNVRSAIGVPLSDGRERIGTLTARSLQPYAFKSSDAAFLQAVGNVVAAAIDRLRTEEQLKHAQRLESIGQLTGGIAHDFNNLLTVISGNLQMIEDAVQDDPLLLKSVTAARRATGRGADLTRKLLVFSRRQALRPQSVTLAEHVPNLVELLRRTLGANIQCDLQVAPATPACKVDPAQLDNALLNLALNARDAMPSGGSLRIEVTPAVLDVADIQRHPDVKAGEYVSISVSDTGEGMTPDVMAHAFEPFFTTKSAGKGSGLGLAMVYGFIKQSGGHVTLESEPGVGTTFRLYLPPCIGPLPIDAKTRSARKGQGECILLVEDDADVRELAAGFLKASGFKVLEAPTPERAMEHLRNHSDIALMFTDVVLAGTTSGPMLAEQVLREWTSLKILFTTGYARGGLPAEVSGRRFPLLRKPYTREELIHEICDALNPSGDKTQPGIPSGRGLR